MAISSDTSRKSREFADAYGIDFPLLEDVELRWAEKYSGVSTDGFAIPGLLLIGQDGGLLFREIGSAKDDRVYLPELLEIVDRELGTEGPAPSPDAGKTQVRGGLAAGVETEEASFAGGLSMAVLRELGPLGLGLEIGYGHWPGQLAGGGVLLQLRKSYWHGVGAFTLELPLGAVRALEAEGQWGFHHGLRLGTETEWSPRVFSFVAIGFEGVLHRAGGSVQEATQLLGTLGFGWKI